LDTDFASSIGNGANNWVDDIAIQPDGKILIGGNFTTFNFTTVNRLARLNSDGTLDGAFSNNVGSGLNGAVSRLTIQPDSNIVLGGSFSTFNGVSANRIARIGGAIAEY
jgi:hypothetical protein